jgi:hypothetical protein
MLTCMSDPFCLSHEDFRPTRSLFPGLQIDANGDPIRTGGMQGNQEGDRQKWVWTQKELEKLDNAAARGTGRARGTIPLHKLFVLTWVSAGVFPRNEKSVDVTLWNPVGNQDRGRILAGPRRIFVEPARTRMDHLVRHTSMRRKNPGLTTTTPQSVQLPKSYLHAVLYRKGMFGGPPDTSDTKARSSVRPGQTGRVLLRQAQSAA